MTLPTLNRTIDDDFMNTWYEIRPNVIDNVLTANVFWLALKEYGCLVPQVGGEYITRSLGYGTKSTQRFSKGSVLTQEIKKLDTMARWDWRYFLVDVNRTLIDDRKNAGKFKIKSYIARRLEAAQEALKADLDTYVHQWSAYYTGDLQPNGLYDVNPMYVAEAAVGDGGASDTQATGSKNGNIARATNAWFRNWTAESVDHDEFLSGAVTESYNYNLVPDLDHAFNTISANMEAPNFILTHQAVFEALCDEMRDRVQIVRTGFNKTAADLGFETVTHRGATVTWSSKLPTTGTVVHIHLLNMNHLEFVYDPDCWFDMLDWRTTTNQLERVTYIACMTPGLITEQPRRHGSMEYDS